MKRLRLLLPLLLLAGCSSVNLVPRGAVELTPIEPSLTVSSRWSAEIGGGVGYRDIALTPLLRDGVIYAADRFGLVVARDARGGQRLWHVDLEQPLQTGIGDGGDSLILGSGAQLIALDPEDGSERWRRTLPSKIDSRAIEADGKLLLMTVDGKLTALDAADGRTLWSREEEVPALSLHGSNVPVVSGERVFAGFANGRLRAYSLSDGEPIWAAQVASPRGRSELERMVDVDAGLQLGNGMVFVAAFQGQVGAFGLVNGRQYWSRPEISVSNDLLLGDDALYLTDTDGTVWALSWRDGATLWRQEALHRRKLSAPVLQGDYLVVGDYDGYLHWLDRRDGSLQARTRVLRLPVRLGLDDSEDPDNGFPEERSVMVSPLTADDGYLYALDKRGVLEAYQVAPGAP